MKHLSSTLGVSVIGSPSRAGPRRKFALMPNIFGRTIRRALALLLRPAFRFLLRRLPVPDPWERLSTRVSFAMVGSRRDFSWYFEGESTVQVAPSNPMINTRLRIVSLSISR